MKNYMKVKVSLQRALQSTCTEYMLKETTSGSKTSKHLASYRHISDGEKIVKHLELCIGSSTKKEIRDTADLE